ncbi:MAG: carboxymuconolactone decarboxylase family protein [Proteobacteria bacterium]|nr:carboxymuconolactone decarboxylase family protein [Pseudomonadota bacterium]HQR02980.1 hypothetical protein [Rhodocyclaceae bacterium]
MGHASRINSRPERQTGHIVRDSAFGLAPDLLEPVVQLTNRIWTGSSVNPALLEMVRLRNARTVNCTICKATRYAQAKADGLDENKVGKVADGYLDSDLSVREKLALEFTDVYLKNPAGASPDLLARLRTEFSDAQIADMAVALTTFHAMSRCAVSLGGLPESLPVFEMSVPSI